MAWFACTKVPTPEWKLAMFVLQGSALQPFCEQAHASALPGNKPFCGIKLQVQLWTLFSHVFLTFIIYILWFVSTLCLAKQWPVGLVFHLRCIFKCSSDSATATCLWDCLHSEIWWGPTYSYRRASKGWRSVDWGYMFR